MNNIYKVIWSKAKNCYVVASEIARAHTKSASGSEKIGGVTRRSLLASLMALSLLFGGLGVASAANGTVHVAESSASSDPAVYTTEKVNILLDGKADKTALDSKANETEVVKNTENIATNTANINTLRSELGNKADESTVTTELGGKANTSLNNLDEAGKSVIKTMMADELAKKADKSYVDNAVAGAVTTAGTNVNEKLKDYAKTTYVDTEVGKKANKATTLAGYEITDAYTKEEVARELDKKADLTALNQATDKINDQQTAIDDLKKKTAEISHVDGDGTNISGVKITDGNIVGNGHSAITGLANVKTDQINGKSLAGTTVATEKEVKDVADAVKTETDERKAADTALEEKIAKNTKDIATLDGKVATAEGNITDLKKKDTELEGRIKTNEGDIETNKNAISDINKRTAGIQRIDATKETTIEGNVIVNSLGNVTAEGDVTAKGKLTGDGVDAGAGAITTKGAVNAGSLNVTDASHLKGDVTMDNKLSVTGDTSLKKTDVEGALTVTGASDLKGNVILGTNAANTVTVNGTADFNGAANMNKGLTVTSGESSLKNTTVDGTLSVNKETTLNGKLTANDEATFTKKVTMENDLEVKGELKTDKIAMENKKTDADGTRYNSSTTITADGITHIGEVEKNGVITKSQFTHTEKGSETYAMKGDATDWTETRSDLTADGVNTEVKDSKGNRTNTSQTKEGINGFAIDKDGNSSTTSQTAKDINGNVTDKDGNKTDMKVTATENRIQIQDKDGKNTNLQVNTMGSSVTEIKNEEGKTTKTEQTATDITNTAEQGTIKNNAMNIENNASGNITNNAQHGTITNDAQNIVNNATGDMTNTVGGKLTTTVAGQATENFNGGLDTTVAGTEKHTVNGKQINTVTEGQENIISGGQTNTITGGQINNITGDQTTTITGNKKETVTENVTEDYQKDLTTTVGGNETHEVKGTKTETVEGKVTENFKNGQETNVTGDQVIKVSGTQTTTATDINRNASSGMIDTIDNDYGTNTETKVAGKTTTDVSIKGTEEKGQYIRGANESRDYLIKGTLKNSETKTAEATSTEITDGTNKASTIQDAKNLAGSVTNGTETGVSGIHANKDGSVSIDSAVIDVTDRNKYSVINQKKGSIQSTVVDGTNSTVILQDKDNVTIASSNGIVAIGGKDIVNNAQDTITNTAGTKITDTAGDSTVTTENGKGTTFAKNGSKAYSTEVGAPTDTNIAGNLITTGRVDANELGVSDKDEHGNTADFSVKAGEGVKASAGNGTTTGSLDVKGDKVESSVKEGDNGSTISQTKDTIESTVKDGDNETSIKQTATDITNTAKDGTIKNDAKDIVNQASKSITNKVGDNTSETMKEGEITTSIKDGAKKNTVISTADGTSFFNSEAWEPVTGASGVGTAKNTTIKGNTITTGKVTMDYADVMKDLGVYGNAIIDGTTTTKTLHVKENATVDGTLNVAKEATFQKSVSIANDLSVGGNATITGDVTARSYSVGGKTYIDANGINANNQKITNVADGSISEGSKDAVNGGQLYGVKNDLEGKVNKVGANAAAMANLHPMEFDPDSKWNIAAAIGNYGSETAAALGAFYRPNDDVMVNLSTAFGTGENMVGGGVSVRLGKGGNKLSREESAGG